MRQTHMVPAEESSYRWQHHSLSSAAGAHAVHWAAQLARSLSLPVLEPQFIDWYTAGSVHRREATSAAVVQQGWLLQDWLAPGLAPVQKSSLTEAPSLRSHQTLRVWVPPPQFLEQAVQDPYCQR